MIDWRSSFVDEAVDTDGDVVVMIPPPECKTGCAIWSSPGWPVPIFDKLTMPPPVNSIFPAETTTDAAALDDWAERLNLARFGDMSDDVSSWLYRCLALQYSRWCKSRSTPTNLDRQRLHWITSDATVEESRILFFGTGRGEVVRIRETSGLVDGILVCPLQLLLSRMIWPFPLPLEDVDSRLKMKN